MVFVAIRALPVLTYPLSRDQGTYFLIGKSLLAGKQLYRDLWDNKPPAIFYLYGIIGRIFGRVMWSSAVADILWLLAISYLIFRFSERYIGSVGGAITAAFHASWHVQAGYVWTAQPETFQLLCIFLGYFLMAGADRWPKVKPFAAGLLLGVGFWLKYNAIAFLPFLAVVPYLDTRGLDREPPRARLALSLREWLIKVSALFGGFGATIVAVLVYFRLVGAWPAMREIQFEVLPRYAAMAIERSPHYWRWIAISTEFFVGRWTEIVTLVALVAAWRLRDLRRFAPLFLAAAIGWASVAMQLRFHDYYFQTCLPFFALMWGYLGVRLCEGCKALAGMCTARRWRVAAALVWVAFANLIYWPLPDELGKISVEYKLLREWSRDRDSFYAHYPWQRWIENVGGQLGAARYLRQNSAPDDGVFMWGAHCVIYYLADRRPPTRFVSNLGLMARWSPPTWKDELMRDLEKSPPRFIVVASRDTVTNITYTILDSRSYLSLFPRLDHFINDNYQQVAGFGPFFIYRRNVPVGLPSRSGGLVATQRSERHTDR